MIARDHVTTVWTCVSGPLLSMVGTKGPEVTAAAAAATTGEVIHVSCTNMLAARGRHHFVRRAHRRSIARRGALLRAEGTLQPLHPPSAVECRHCFHTFAEGDMHYDSGVNHSVCNDHEGCTLRRPVGRRKRARPEGGYARFGGAMGPPVTR